jgi:hypothetical protein
MPQITSQALNIAMSGKKDIAHPRILSDNLFDPQVAELFFRPII